MAEYLTNTADLTAVADAIRAKGGTSAQLVYPAGFVSAIQAIQSGVAVQLIVKTRVGASVTATKGSTTVSGTAGTDGTCTLEITEAGEWAVTSSKSGDSQSKTILIGTQDIELPLTNAVFAENTWERIIEVCKAGAVPDTWVAGDSKTMTIDGTEYQIDIIGKNHDDYADGSGKAPLTLQLHDCYGTAPGYVMSNVNSNVGGWKECTMRTTYLPAMLALMPSEVQSGIREVSKTTTVGDSNSQLETVSDKLFLLSEMEIFGVRDYSAKEEGTQYAYYAAGGSKVKKLEGTANNWWERSPQSMRSTRFCMVDSTGAAKSYTAGDNFGVAFAFCF